MLLIILGSVLMLGVCIFIHELGHLLCGMLVGVKARIFSIGYGKGIWKKRVGGTIYQITGIPIGGYVMFKGDNYSRRLKGQKGELLSTPPLKRMVPVIGGPLFNLIMGFLIFFVLALTGDNSAGNKIFIDPSDHDYSRAYKAGLRSGDVILSVNGNETKDFEEIFTHIGLSAGEPLLIKYRRGMEVKELKVNPDVYSAGGRPTIGIQPAGKRNVVVTFKYSEQFQYWLKNTFKPREEQLKADKKLLEIQNKTVPTHRSKKKPKQRTMAIAYLNDGDVILEVEGEPIQTVGELQKVLGKYQNQEVKIKVERKLYPLLTPWSTELVEVKVPVRKATILEFSEITDAKYSSLSVPSFSIPSYDPSIKKTLLNLKIEGKSFKTFDELTEFIKEKESESVLKMKVGDLEYTASVKIKPIGLLGFRPGMKFEPEVNQQDVGVFQAIKISTEKVYKIVNTSFIGIKMLLTGLLSPKDNLSGPNRNSSGCRYEP